MSDNTYAKEIYAEMLFENEAVKFQVNSSASVNILPAKYARNQQIEASNKTLRMWNGTHVEPIGSTGIVVHNPRNQKKYAIEFLVVREPFMLLLARCKGNPAHATDQGE